MSSISFHSDAKRMRDGSSVESLYKRHLLSDNNDDGVPDPNSDSASRSKKKHRTKKANKEFHDEERMFQDEQEMKRLESSLFGSLYYPLEFGKEDEGEEDNVDNNVGSGLSIVVDKSFGGDGCFLKEHDLASVDEMGIVDGEKKPAWVDDEEEVVDVNIEGTDRLRKLKKQAAESVIPGGEYVSRLRAQHVKLNPGTDWARVGHEYDDGDDSDCESGVVVAPGYKDSEKDDILWSSSNLVLKRGTKLLPGILEYTRLMDGNGVEPSNAPIHSVQFHRNAQLMLAAGLDRRLRFFQIDGKRNPKIQSVFIEDCPIRKASFTPDGSQVIIAGRRSFFYSFDLVSAKADKVGPLAGREERSFESFEVSSDSKTVAFIGNDGHILLVSPKTKQLINTLKMNGSCRSLAFADDGNMLLSGGGDGKIYHWDLRTRRCLNVGVDEGSLTCTSLCASPDSKLFATGSTSGVVNFYRNEDFMNGKCKPLKTVENLTTTIDQVKFNNDAQILAITSSMNRSSLKLVHVPSFTVFSNFPYPNVSLKHPKCLDFSPGGGFMAVGNAAGRVLLYKLHHYQNA